MSQLYDTASLGFSVCYCMFHLYISMQKVFMYEEGLSSLVMTDLVSVHGYLWEMYRSIP